MSSEQKVDLYKGTPSQIATAIRAMIPTSRATFVWGAPGIAKSATARQVADIEGMAFIDMRLSQMAPEDLRGVPFPTRIGGIEGVRWAAPYVLPKNIDYTEVFQIDDPEEVTIRFYNPKGKNKIHYCTNPDVQVKSLTKGLKAIILRRGEPGQIEEGLEFGYDRVEVALFDAAEYDAYLEASQTNLEAPLPEFQPGRFRITATGKVKGILALEEFNSADLSVQATAYELVLDKFIGEYEVPEDVYIIAMGNRETDKGITYKMPTPISNRFVHLEMESDPATIFEDWQKWAVLNQVHPDVVGYLNAFKGELFQFSPGTASRGFPTPRSWEFVSDILIENDDLNVSILTLLVVGAIGDGSAIQFMSHRKKAKDLPDVRNDVLSGRMKKMERPEISLCYSLATAISYELKSDADRIARESKAEGIKVSQHPDRAAWVQMADNALAFIMNSFPVEISIMSAKIMIATHKLPFDTQKMENFEAFANAYKDFIMQ